MAEPKKVQVLVLKEFYDLKSKEVLIRKVDTVMEVTKSRADYLIERGLVRVFEGE